MNLLHLLLGKSCVFCGRTMDPQDKSELCRDCLAQMKETRVSVPVHETREHVSVYAFADPVRLALHRFKYGGKKAFGRYAGRKIAERFRTRKEVADLVTCVPRARDGLPRMYNQSEILAKVAARELHLPFAPNLLKKRKGALSQTHCATPLMREENAKKAYFTNPKAQNIQGLRILLVDDLYTTGATARACTELLKNQGAAEVFVYTAVSHRADFIVPLVANFDRGHVHAEFSAPPHIKTDDSATKAESFLKNSKGFSPSINNFFFPQQEKFSLDISQKI